MKSIRMVSEEEGERLRKEETERQEMIKTRLKGAILSDIHFEGMGITNHTIRGLVLEKDGTLFTVEIEAEKYYDSIEKQLIITDLKKNEVIN